MLRNILVCILGILLLGVPAHVATGQEPSKAVARLMKKKLDAAQLSLEALALSDFKRLNHAAEELQAVGQAAEWRLIKSPRYDMYSDAFRRSAEELGEAARAKNIDSAALAFMDMTLNCVKCHKYVREIKMTALPRDPVLVASRGP